jgi:hypothetical protein
LLFFIASRKDHRRHMKRTLILLAALCAAAAARADLVMQQQITTPKYDGVATMKVKGAKARMDMYAGQPQALSMITDLNTGETIALLHTQKMYVKSPGAPKNHVRPAGTASHAPVPRATGKTQKVGDYDTELYTWSNVRGITGTAWVAKSFPDYARIQADLTVIDRTAPANNDSTPELGSLPGMVVRSQVAGSGETITMALISAKETTLDASLFGIPRDYKEMPKARPLKPVPAPNSPPKAPGPSKVPGPAQTTGSNPGSSGSRTSNPSKGTDNSRTAPADYSTQKAPAW